MCRYSAARRKYLHSVANTLTEHGIAVETFKSRGLKKLRLEVEIIERIFPKWRVQGCLRNNVLSANIVRWELALFEVEISWPHNRVEGLRFQWNLPRTDV